MAQVRVYAFSCNVSRRLRFTLVVAVAKYSNDEELVELVNGTLYGLSASLYGKDIAHVTDIANKIEAGTVWVNSHSFFEPGLAFGGYKRKSPVSIKLIREQES